MREHWREWGFWRWWWHERVSSPVKMLLAAIPMFLLLGSGFYLAHRLEESQEVVLETFTYERVETIIQHEGAPPETIVRTRRVRVPAKTRTVVRDGETVVITTPGETVSRTVRGPVVERVIRVKGGVETVVRTTRDNRVVTVTRPVTTPGPTQTIDRTVPGPERTVTNTQTNFETVVVTDERTITDERTVTETVTKEVTVTETDVSTVTITVTLPEGD